MSAIRDTIFNNYLTAYGAPKVSRYDSHKKSELRSTYNSIVKLNKESPWYLPVTSKETQQYAVELKESARELRTSLAELGGLEEDGLFDKKHAFSSNEDVISVEYIGEKQDSEGIPTLTMEVKALASPQENTGRSLPEGAVGLPEDTYSFDVGINDMNYEFQFYISEGESNRDLQERLARLVNNSGIGLRAEVVEDGSRSALKIASESTGIAEGKERTFTISDDRTSKRSGAVEYFGLDRMTAEPANATFILNGEERTTGSNHFTVGKLYEITLNGLSKEGEEIRVGLKTDTESVTENVGQLVGSFNTFMKSVSSFMETQRRSRMLVGELGGIAGHYRDALSGLGIDIGEDGELEIDKDKLQQVAESSENLAETFRTLKDFSNSLMRKSNQVSLNPMDYVQRTVVAYKNPGHNFASPYTTSSYSGMMFNYFC